ncbi:MAG: hypothetical protein Q9227_007111 [Pyrenula ochraceoflavens]
MPDTTMKALQLTKPSSSSSQTPNLSLTTLPIPTPTPSRLLIKLHASQIQHSDLLNARGALPQLTLPRIPGRDYSGTVVSAPSPLHQHLLNQAVYGTSGPDLGFTEDGAHAEYVVVEADAVARKPERLSWAQCASGAGFWNTAWWVVEKAGIREGERVLVLGATGRVGSMVCELVENVRKGVVLRAGRREGLEVNTVKDPELEGVVKSTGGNGPDVVLDLVGDIKLTKRALEIIAVGGRMVCIAAPKDGSLELGVNLLSLFRKNVSILGFSSLRVPADDGARALEEMSKFFDEGKLTCWGDDEILKVSLEEAIDVYAGKRNAPHIVIEF